MDETEGPAVVLLRYSSSTTLSFSLMWR